MGNSLSASPWQMFQERILINTTGKCIAAITFFCFILSLAVRNHIYLLSSKPKVMKGHRSWCILQRNHFREPPSHIILHRNWKPYNQKKADSALSDTCSNSCILDSLGFLVNSPGNNFFRISLTPNSHDSYLPKATVTCQSQYSSHPHTFKALLKCIPQNLQMLTAARWRLFYQAQLCYAQWVLSVCLALNRPRLCLQKRAIKRPLGNKKHIQNKKRGGGNIVSVFKKVQWWGSSQTL